MAAPIADIDPQMLNKIFSFLEDINDALREYNERDALISRSKEKKGDIKVDQWKEIMQKIQEGNATYT